MLGLCRLIWVLMMIPTCLIHYRHVTASQMDTCRGCEASVISWTSCCGANHAQSPLMEFPCADEFLICTRTSHLSIARLLNLLIPIVMLLWAWIYSSHNGIGDIWDVSPENATHRGSSIRRISTWYSISNSSIVRIGAISSLCGSAERISLDHYDIWVLFVSLFEKLNVTIYITIIYGLRDEASACSF